MRLLEQDADAASVPCSEQLPNEVDDEGVYATGDLLRPVYDVSDDRAGFVSFALPPLAGTDARGVGAAARRMWHRARRPNVLVQIPATPAGISDLRMRDGRSRLPRLALLCSDDGNARDAALGAVDSSPREQA